MNNKFVKASLAGLMAVSLGACSSSNAPVDNKEPETAAGTFEAKASGYGGELNLTVTIDNNVITDIALGENHETNVVIDRAFPIIRDRILEANSPVVDSVSAATFSSFAVKSAVADAMM